MSITGSVVDYAGGGGGVGFYNGSPVDNGSGAAPTKGGGGAGSNWKGSTSGLSPINPGTDGKGGGGGAGGNGGSGIVILRTAKATATIGAGITVNGISAAGSVSGVAIGGTSDYYYSATLGTGTITFS